MSFHQLLPAIWGRLAIASFGNRSVQDESLLAEQQ